MNAILNGIQGLLDLFFSLFEFIGNWIEGIFFITEHLGSFYSIMADSIRYMPEFLTPFMYLGLSLILTMAIIKLF